MADKQVPLSIIIRTVDKATAGIEAINKKLDELTRPTREFGKALKELGEKSGFNKVSEAFKEVGKASKETFIKLLEGAAIIGETTHLVLEMVESFSALNDTAERVGVSVDALAGLRYAASKSGADIEKLDQGITTFVENLGGVKAGTGKLTKFLGEVAPTMLTQLKATRTTEEALGILAEGMEKLTNKSKQLKFAQEALGDPALAALFHRGPKGIMELMEAYAKLAGPQQEAAERAAKVDDALKDLHASTEGVKAALVSGLSPALSEIIDKLTKWLVDHREDVARWAEDFGKKLPKAVEDLVAWLGRAIDKVGSFVSALGGWKVAAAALAVVMAGDLVAAVIRLGIVMLATPFGQVIAGLAAIAAAASLAIGMVKGLEEALDSLHERMLEDAVSLPSWKFREKHPELAGDAAEIDQTINEITGQAARSRAGLMAQPTGFNATMSMVPVPMIGPTAPAPYPQLGPGIGPAPAQEVKIKLDITGAPKGTRATVDAPAATVDTTVGYQMGGSW